MPAYFAFHPKNTRSCTNLFEHKSESKPCVDSFNHIHRLYIMLKKYVYNDIINIITQYIIDTYKDELGYICTCNNSKRITTISEFTHDRNNHKMNKVYQKHIFKNEYSSYGMHRIFNRQRNRLNNRMNHRLRTFGRTICKVYDSNSWIGINHFSNYYFRFIDVFGNLFW